jgi:Tol biopolymer transport system component
LGHGALTQKEATIAPRQIGFVTDRDGMDQIYVVDTDGTGLHRISNRTGNDFDPAWSPDGRRIAFAHEPGGNTNWDAVGPDSQIWVMNADGTGRTRLTAPGDDTTSCNDPGQQAGGYGPGCWDSHPFWSSDGSAIGFERAGHKDQLEGCPQYEACPSIWMMRTDGTGQHEVAGGRNPEWSPKSATISFDDTWVNDPDCPTSDLGDLYVANADGSHRTDLGVRATAARWSPGGGALVFWYLANESAGCNGTQMIAILTKGSSGRWTKHDVTAGTFPAWSPDGTTLAFVGASGIEIVGTDGVRPLRVPGTSSLGVRGTKVVSFLP